VKCLKKWTVILYKVEATFCCKALNHSFFVDVSMISLLFSDSLSHTHTHTHTHTQYLSLSFSFSLSFCQLKNLLILRSVLLNDWICSRFFWGQLVLRWHLNTNDNRVIQLVKTIFIDINPAECCLPLILKTRSHINNVRHG